jgi:RNA polymerase sigma factor (sigma-70 family)
MLMTMGDGLMKSDGDLLGTYSRSRDEEAFRELVQRYSGLVHRTARRALGRDGDTVDDVCQAVFVILADKARTLTGYAQVAPWLYRTTCLVVMHAKRENARRRQRETAAAALQSHEDAPMIDNPALEHLDAAIATLSVKQQEAVTHHYLMGRSIGETADALGCPTETVKDRVAVGLAKLRDYFAKRGLAMSTTALAMLMIGEAQAAAPVAVAIPASTALSGKVLHALALAKLKMLAAGVLGTVAVALLGTAFVHQEPAMNPSNPPSQAPVTIVKKADLPANPPAVLAGVSDILERSLKADFRQDRLWHVQALLEKKDLPVVFIYSEIAQARMLFTFADEHATLDGVIRSICEQGQLEREMRIDQSELVVTFFTQTTTMGHEFVRRRADSNDPAERTEAAVACCMTGDRYTVEQLVTLALDRDEQVRRKSLELLFDDAPCAHSWGSVAEALPESFKNSVSQQLESLHAKDRKTYSELSFIRYAAMVGSDAILREALTSEDRNIRAAAAAGMGADPQAIDILIDLFRSESDLQACMRKARLLIKTGGAQAFSVLAEAVQGDQEVMRRAAAVALCLSAKSEAVPLVVGALKHTDPETRSWAVNYAGDLLRKTGSEDLKKALLDARSDDSVEVRQYAIASIGLAGLPDSIELLLPMQSDQDDGIRSGATIGLSYFRDDRIVAKNIAMANDESERVGIRMAAAASLAWSHAPDANQRLIQMMGPESPNSHRIGAIAARYASDPQVIDSLISLLDDTDAGVRSAAAEALGFHNEPRLVRPLIERLNGGQPDIADQVLKILRRNFRLNDEARAAVAAHDKKADLPSGADDF